VNADVAATEGVRWHRLLLFAVLVAGAFADLLFAVFIAASSMLLHPPKIPNPDPSLPWRDVDWPRELTVHGLSIVAVALLVIALCIATPRRLGVRTRCVWRGLSPRRAIDDSGPTSVGITAGIIGTTIARMITCAMESL
jgi:hypothetical protein